MKNPVYLFPQLVPRYAHKTYTTQDTEVPKPTETGSDWKCHRGDSRRCNGGVGVSREVAAARVDRLRAELVVPDARRTAEP